MRPPYRTGWLLALLLLSGCAGFSSARDMTRKRSPPNRTSGSATACAPLRTKVACQMPADASALRGLDSCVIEGVKKRHQDDKADKKRPMSCTLSGSVLPPECW